MRVAQAAVLAVVEAKLVLAAVEAKVAAGLAVVEANMVAAEMVREATVLEAAAVTALEMWAPEDEVRVTQSVPLVVASKVVACRVKGAAAETALEAGVMVVGQQASTTLRSWQCAMFGQASDRAWRPVRNTDWMSTVRNGSQCMQKRKRSSLSFFCLPVCVDRPSSVVPGSFTCS